MTAKNKMIAIVGKAVTGTLENYANTQPNLASETTRFKIATEILDAILKVIDDPEFKS
tara:strand:+ start:189 stop:362 length:174 start_codon:yes stop_codon:yes gene_type:complete